MLNEVVLTSEDIRIVNLTNLKTFIFSCRFGLCYSHCGFNCDIRQLLYCCSNLDCSIWLGQVR